MRPVSQAANDGGQYLERRMRTRSAMLAVVMFVFGLYDAHSLARAESVYVKYRGEVDLAPFDCTDITGSSFIYRVCYDEANEYMLINLRGTYYHYCGIDDGTVSALLAAGSMGRFYNANIKGNFDCRINRVPEYDDDNDQSDDTND
jgi:hypothetical protein